MRDSGELVRAPIGTPVPQLEVDVLRCHVCMWGVVWDGGAVFAQYDGHLTAASYIDLLDEHVLPHKDNLRHRVFLLDRHAAHTAKVTQRWLARNDLAHEVLPTHSPQFNAIEGCWAWIKQRARQECAAFAGYPPGSLCSGLQRSVPVAHRRSSEECAEESPSIRRGRRIARELERRAFRCTVEILCRISGG